MITCTFEDGGAAKLRHCVVDNIIVDNNKILLVKRAPHMTNPGKYALAGGFVERDETTHDAVIREIKEETGYVCEVEFLLRIADNPDRMQEDRQNISFVYVVKALEKVGEKDNESSEVKWFDLDSLPLKDQFAFDHYDNVQLYMSYLKHPFALPHIGKV